MPIDRRTDPDPDGVFPGIFAGATAGDFAGLPPTPADPQATGRVPELAIRLSGIAETLSAVICHTGCKSGDAARRAAAKLHAIADEIAGEGGEQ